MWLAYIPSIHNATSRAVHDPAPQHNASTQPSKSSTSLYSTHSPIDHSFTQTIRPLTYVLDHSEAPKNAQDASLPTNLAIHQPRKKHTIKTRKPPNPTHQIHQPTPKCAQPQPACTEPASTPPSAPSAPPNGFRNAPRRGVKPPATCALTPSKTARRPSPSTLWRRNTATGG